MLDLKRILLITPLLAANCSNTKVESPGVPDPGAQLTHTGLPNTSMSENMSTLPERILSKKDESAFVNQIQQLSKISARLDLWKKYSESEVRLCLSTLEDMNKRREYPKGKELVDSAKKAVGCEQASREWVSFFGEGSEQAQIARILELKAAIEKEVIKHGPAIRQDWNNLADRTGDCDAGMQMLSHRAQGFAGDVFYKFAEENDFEPSPEAFKVAFYCALDAYENVFPKS